MDFNKIVNNRVSIRNFKNTEVSRDILKDIVNDAQKAPSWANSQPWKVYIAVGDTMNSIKKEHLEKSINGIKGNSDLAVKDIKKWGDLPWSNMKEWLGKVETDPTMTSFADHNANLWNAPSIAYITIPSSAPVWSIYDAGSFAQTLMLSATSHGIDSMVAYENVKYPDEIRKYLSVPDNETIVAGIALGYRSDDKINSFTNNRISTNKILTIK